MATEARFVFWKHPSFVSYPWTRLCYREGISLAPCPRDFATKDVELPANKNHHYVPQMYMRLFARAGENRIGIFVVDRAQFIPNAPIRGQACRKYFYGNDPRIERALGYLEGQAARIFSGMIKHQRLPATASQDFEWLVLYLTTQHLRTAGAAGQHNDRSEKAAKAFLRHKAEMEGNSELLAAMDKVRISRPDAVSELISYAASAADLLSDLQFSIIKNMSNLPFVSSDTPVVLHNSLYENQCIGVTGYANVGLQLFLPLGPKVTLFGFDPGAYDVYPSSDEVIEIYDDEQVSLINDLQWEAADTVLLLPPNMPILTLKASDRDLAYRRGRERTTLRTEVERLSERKVVTRYGSGSAPSAISLNLRFVKERLPKPGLLANWETPPFRDQDRKKGR